VRRATVAALVACAWLIAPVVQASEVTPAREFSISGVVLHAGSNQPLSGVKIEVFQPLLAEQISLNAAPAPAQTLTSGADGRFRLTQLQGGPLTVVFSKLGYQSIRYDLDPLGQNGPFEIGPILMARLATGSLPTCGSLVQPGQTASVYVVCGWMR